MNRKIAVLLLLTAAALVWIPGISALPDSAQLNISGYKINDINGNGIWDAGEVGVAGWNITLKDATTGSEVANTSTDTNGFYQFTGIANGSYNVTEELRAGWVPTNATFRVVDLNQDVTDINFTNKLEEIPATFNISGYKVNDTDGNGVWTPGEAGIQGWRIILKNATTGSEVANTSTDANGFYQFVELAPGGYNVTEETTAGWIPTNATFRVVDLNQDITDLNFTNRLIAPVLAFNVSGYKINDTDGNGVWDAGEAGIQGWRIILKNASTGAEIANTSTDASGFYQFTNLINGSYNVTEELRAEWVPTNVTFRLIELSQDITDLNFTNKLTVPVLTFSISGYKINDTNGNGKWDAGEVGIAGWNITLKNATTGSEVASTSTDASGFYQFTNLVSGSYNVTEELGAGWVPTNATFRVIELSQDITDLNFTNQPLPTAGSISGYKISDTNGNGVWDPGEMGLANWEIQLIGITGTGINTNIIREGTTTDALGFYEFDNLPAGIYIIVEKLKKGFTPTDTPVKIITLAQGENSRNNNFTNQPVQRQVTFSISGYKINDADGNGAWTPGERGIKGWKITLKNATTGSEVASTSTDASGFYRFTGIAPGSYNVTEEMRTGWVPTNIAFRVIDLSQDVTNLNFTNKLKEVLPAPSDRINITVEIRPETLNLASKGKFKAFITLPEDLDVADINLDTVVCEGAHALKGETSEEDDGTLVVTFNRQDLVNVPAEDTVILRITGNLSDGTPFEGSDTVRIINNGRKGQSVDESVDESVDNQKDDGEHSDGVKESEQVKGQGYKKGHTGDSIDDHSKGKGAKGKGAKKGKK